MRMRRIALVAGFLTFAGIALGALPARFKYEMATCPTGTASITSSSCIAAQACSAGSCTGTAPSTAAEGMWLGGLKSYRLTVCAASGQTLSGAGTMQAYSYNSAEALWVRVPGLDQNVTISAKQCQSYPDFSVGNSFDRVRFVSSAVTVSAGATLDVLLDGQTLGK